MTNQTSSSKPQLTFPRPVSQYLRQSYSKSNNILEYGSGGSTVLASEMPQKSIVSIESDRSWVANLNDYLCNSSNTLSMPELQHIDIGPTKEWGHPVSMSHYKKFPNYAFEVWNKYRDLDPDVVLIDGRFRVSCFVATVTQIKSPTTILFDDYVEREKYHWVENIIKPSRTIERMGVFEVTPIEFPASLILDSIKHSLDPS